MPRTVEEEDDVIPVPVEVVATRRENITQSPIDGFSLGHIIMGQVVFLISAAVLEVFEAPQVNTMAFAVTIAFAIIWEILENTLLHRAGFKFDNKRDSIANSATDVILVVAGLMSAFFIPLWQVTVIAIVAEFLLFVTWYFLQVPSRE